MSYKTGALVCVLACFGTALVAAQNAQERPSEASFITTPTAYHLPARMERVVRPIPSVNPLRFPEIQAACQDNLQANRIQTTRLPGQGGNQLCPGRVNLGTPVTGEGPRVVLEEVSR